MQEPKWHPKLAEKMEENRYNSRTLAEPLYHCRETVLSLIHI